MVSATQLISLFAVVGIAASADAPVVLDSIDTPKYVANFEITKNSDITGKVEFIPTNNGSVLVNVLFGGLPSGSFSYRINEDALGSSGSCTGSVFDPFSGSSDASSEAGKPVGDLSGKHGEVKGPSDQFVYIDKYVSTNNSDVGFIGGKSIVILQGSTPLVCSNITKETEESSLSMKPSGSSTIHSNTDSKTKDSSKTTSSNSESTGSKSADSSSKGSKSVGSSSASGSSTNGAGNSYPATGYAAGILAVGLGLLV